MNRRQFIQMSAGAAAISALTVHCQKEHEHFIDIVTRLVRQNDKRIPDLQSRQELKPEHKWYGGVLDGHGIHSSGLTAAYIRDHMRKPTVALIVGRTAPPGAQMGHAGAIIEGHEGTAASKIEALNAAGTLIAKNAAEIPQLIKHLGVQI